MAENIANQIARQLYAMASKKRDENIAEKLRDEKYQRSWTDEYPWLKKPVPREPISAEQREHWEKMARLRGD